MSRWSSPKEGTETGWLSKVGDRRNARGLEAEYIQWKQR